MEMEFLLFLQELHNQVLDVFFSTITRLGDGGIFWIILCLVMLCTKKYRKWGVLFALSMLCCFLIGNIALKNIVARSRPCWVNPDITLLIKNPQDYSFPSGHSMISFTSALSIWYANKKWGIAAFILASVIAFSRLYLFVHYPTDVLMGILIGLAVSFLVHKAGEIFETKKEGVKQIENV